MKTVELKIFNQTLKVNLADGSEDFYAQIAGELDGLMSQEASKSAFISDAKVAVRVAFMLAAENAKLKEALDKSDKVIDRIAINLKTIDI